MRYRADIDGLRAVAVLSVVLFHAGLSLFRGGFVGVDIFFVISGYLITQVIVDRLEAGGFSFGWFYERRIRRILPALLAMLLLTSAMAFFWLLAPEMEAFAKSLVAATLSVSNFYFWSTSGYFAPPTAIKPLLHTWSLAIEEQFYLFYPVLLLVCHRWFPRSWRRILAFLTVALFALAVVATRMDQDSAFYLLHARAWELLLGGVVAVGAWPEPRRPWVSEGLALTGAAMLAYAVARFTGEISFPGLSAALPCVGAALIIGANREGTTWVGKALSLRPVVFVGLISYSLYLWHWPLLVFKRTSMTGVPVYGVLALAFVLAALSWKFIEAPFRAGHGLVRASVFARVAAGAAAALLVGAVCWGLQGMPGRFPPETRKLAAFLDYDPDNLAGRARSCFLTGKLEFPDFDRDGCLGLKAGARNELLLGDSHAAHLWSGLAQALPEVNLLEATAAGCKPRPEGTPGAGARCAELMRFVYSDFLEHARVDRVILAARWNRGDLASLPRILDELARRKIAAVLFGPIVEYDSALPRLLAAAAIANDRGVPDAHRDPATAGLDAELRQLAAARGVPYVSMVDAVCPGGHCEVFAGETPLQFDYGHLTREGSVFLMARLKERGVLR